jgi:cytosine/adenosine deaminase-related metal-dependent hydrolase
MHAEESIGSIEPGKRADIVLIRTDSPCMVAAMDLAAAIVMNYRQVVQIESYQNSRIYRSNLA